MAEQSVSIASKVSQVASVSSGGIDEGEALKMSMDELETMVRDLEMLPADPRLVTAFVGVERKLTELLEETLSRAGRIDRLEEQVRTVRVRMLNDLALSRACTSRREMDRGEGHEEP